MINNDAKEPNLRSNSIKERESEQKEASEAFQIDDDYLNKKGCTSITLGPEEIEQPCYVCHICNPSRDHYLCTYCYKNCHQICREIAKEQINERADRYKNYEFACYCGINLKHKPEKPPKREHAACSMLQLDYALGISLRYCPSHKCTICSICSVDCHRNCKVIEWAENDTDIDNCLCQGEKHTSFNEIALSFPLDAYKQKTGVSVWPLQILNILFHNKNIFQKLVLLFTDIINQKNLKEEEKKRFYPLLELFSNTFNRKFKAYYYDDIILNMFEFEKLIIYFKSIQAIDSQTILVKFRLTFILLFIHLKKDFQMVKTLTSVDFLTKTILERIEYKKILMKPNLYTKFIDEKYNLEELFKEDSELKRLVLDDVCRLMEIGDDYVSIEENQDEFEIGLKYICFMLKKIMFAKGDLIKLINSLTKFHSKFFDYIISDKGNIYSLLDIFSGLVEIFYMIAVTYNDIIIMEYLDNSDKDKAEQEEVSGFIHQTTEHGETLFKMVLKNCDILRKHYDMIQKPDCSQLSKEEIRRKKILDREKRRLQAQIEEKTTGVKVKLPPNGGLITEKIIKLFNETLNIFSLADNIYYKQFKSIKRSDIIDYFHFCDKIEHESFPSFGKPNEGNTHHDLFFEMKISIEAKLHDLFSSSYTQTNLSIHQKISEIIGFFSMQMTKKIEACAENLTKKRQEEEENQAKNNKNGTAGETPPKVKCDMPLVEQEPENQIEKKKLVDFVEKLIESNDENFPFLKHKDFPLLVEDFVDCLIFSSMDETLSKVLVYFSDRDFPLLLTKELIDKIFSFLSLYFFTKRGMKYFLMGKNLTRLNKLFNRFCCKKDGKNIKTSFGRTMADNIDYASKVLTFTVTMMKGVHVYDLGLRDHKVLLRFKNNFLNHIENYSPISKEMTGKGMNGFKTFKEHLTNIMKMLYSLSDDFEFEEYEDIKTRILMIFYFSPWNLLDNTTFTSHFSGLNDCSERNDSSILNDHSLGEKSLFKKKEYDEESEDSKLLLNDNTTMNRNNKRQNKMHNNYHIGNSNGVVKHSPSNNNNIQPIFSKKSYKTPSKGSYEKKTAMSLYFAFFNVVSKRTYYSFCQENEEMLLQSLYRFSDLKDYKILFETSQLSLKQKTSMLKFCRSYYLIDHLNPYNIFEQKRHLTTNEFKQLIESNTIVEQNIGEFLTFHDVLDLSIDQVKILQSKYDLINQIEIVMQLYISELRNFPNQLVDQHLKHVEDFYAELLFGLKFISNFFYLEKEIWSKINLTFYELTLEFLPKIQLFKTVFKEMHELGKINTTSEPPSEEINAIMDKLQSTAFNIYNKKEIYKYITEGFEDIFTTTNINSEFSLSKYLDVFDNMAEANFTPFSLIETLDYEYFYEEESEEAEKELMKDPLYCKLKSIESSFIDTFIDINNTTFLSVISTISNETVVIDYRRKIVDYFNSFLNSIESGATYKLEGLLCIITKMLFYDGEEMQTRFENLITDKFFFPNFNRLVNQNIVLTIALSRNFFAFDRAIMIINLTKLCIQFLQALGEGFNTAYHDNIFKFQKDIKVVNEQDDKSESSYQSEEEEEDEPPAKNTTTNNNTINNIAYTDSLSTLTKQKNTLISGMTHKMNSHTLTNMTLQQIVVNKTIYESIIHNLKRAFFFLDLDLLIEAEMPYDKLIILTTNFVDFLIEFIQTTEDKEDIIKQNMNDLLFGRRRREIKDVFEIMDYKGVMDVFFVKIKPEPGNKKQYDLRKKVICYVKIKYLQMLISYLQTGGKEKMVDKLMNKKCSPIELYQEILYNFQQLLMNYQERDEKAYKSLIKIKSDERYVQKLIDFYSNEASFRNIIEFPVILKYYILIKTFEDVYSQNALKDHFEKMDKEQTFSDTESNCDIWGIRSRFSKRVHMFLEKIVLKIEIRKAEGNEDEDNDNSEKIAKMVLRKMNRNTSSEIIEEEDDDDDEEAGGTNGNNQITFFVRPYLTFFLSDHSKKSFEDKVDRTNATSKFVELIEHSDYCLFEMVVNSHTIGRNRFLLWMAEIDFFYIELFNYLIIIAQNALIMVHYYRSPSLPSNEYDIVDEDILLRVWTDNLALSICQIVFLTIAMIVWYYFKFPNCYQLNLMQNYKRSFVFRKKGADNIIPQKVIDFFQTEDTSVVSVLRELNKDVNTWKMLYIGVLHSMLGNREINILIFTLVFNIIYLTTESSMLLVIPTLFIANLTPTLFDIFKAMQMKFSNMITVLLFTYLLVYIFMWITFFYMADLFTFDDILEVNSEAEITESFCFSSIQCFLFMVQQGVRAGGGIGDVIPMVSFQSDPIFFVLRFVYDMLFFILIIMVLGNVFLGIIVDTFAELRDQNQSKDNDRSNICFICQLSRDACLTRNIDFNKHVSTVHFVWNYVYFLTYLHINNPNDFNRLENSVWERLEEQDFGWIPIEKSAED